MHKHLFTIIVVLFCLSCKNDHTTSKKAKSSKVAKQVVYQELRGKTMGTTYTVKYAGTQPQLFQNRIEQLLRDINAEVSTYIDSSTISLFNQSAIGIVLQDTRSTTQTNTHFRKNIEAAQKIYRQSEGFFDPTIMPLVNYWGFGYEGKDPVTAVDTQKVHTLRQHVGLEKIRLHFDEAQHELRLQKDQAQTQLDFSAIAKGYAVDAVSELLEAAKIAHYFVEIGGETRTKGTNPDGNIWRIGINVPQTDAAFNDFYTILAVSDKAMATSGNYRNFKEVNGKKYGHTIHPKTGFPEINTTASATVVAPNCMTADAWATAFMVMGYQKALVLTNKLPHIETYLIYASEDGSLRDTMSQGMSAFLIK